MFISDHFKDNSIGQIWRRLQEKDLTILANNLANLAITRKGFDNFGKGFDKFGQKQERIFCGIDIFLGGFGGVTPKKKEIRSLQLLTGALAWAT